MNAQKVNKTDLFDLGLMNEEEYNLIKKELTPIIMGN